MRDKHQIIEEPCEVKVSRTVLKTSEIGDSLAEFNSFLATSTGEAIARPRFFVDLQRKLKLLQQRVSHKKLGSNNWRKAKSESSPIARTHSQHS
jgi:transposase